ncbi:hypothetical protein AAK967_01780 [Atopobiaceae bacterium 24-176]
MTGATNDGIAQEKRPKKRVAIVVGCVAAVLVAAACVGVWLLLCPAADPFAHEPGQMPDLARLVGSGADEGGYIDGVDGLFPFNDSATGARVSDHGLSLYLRSHCDEQEWMLDVDVSDVDGVTSYGGSWTPTFFEAYESPVSEAAGGLPSSGMSLIVAGTYCPAGFDGADEATVRDLLSSIGFDGESLQVSEESRGMRTASNAVSRMGAAEDDGPYEEFGVRYTLSGTVRNSAGTELPVSFQFDNGGVALWAQVSEDARKLQLIPLGERAVLYVGNTDASAAPAATDGGWTPVGADWEPWDVAVPEEGTDDEKTAALLKGVYDSLAVIDEELDRGYEQFEESYLTAPLAQRETYGIEAYRNLEDIAAIYTPFMDYLMMGNLPEGSTYYEQAAALGSLCDDLSARATTLYDAWAIDVQYEDPVPREEEILARLRRDDNGQGVDAYEADFDENYPKWSLS